MVKSGDVVYPEGYEPTQEDEKSIETRKSLLNAILGDHSQ